MSRIARHLTSGSRLGGWLIARKAPAIARKNRTGPRASGGRWNAVPSAWESSWPPRGQRSGPISTIMRPRRCARKRAKRQYPHWRRRAIRPRFTRRAAQRAPSSRRRARRLQASSASRPVASPLSHGGTEAANFALNPFFGVGTGAAPLDRLIVGAGEHPCVLFGHRFPVSTVETAPFEPRRTHRSRLARGRGRAAGSAARRAASGEQRDRRRPAGRRGGRACPRGRRLPLLRRGAAGRSSRLRHRRPLRRCARAFRPQDGGAEGGRRAGDRPLGLEPRRAAEFAAADRNAARVAALRTLRRLRALAPRSAPAAPMCRSPSGSRRFAAGSSGSSGRRPPMRSCSATRRPIAQHAVFRSPRRRGRDPDHRARPRRRCGQLRLGLLLGQGDAVARACGDGRQAGTGAGSDPAEPRLRLHRRRCRTVRRGVLRRASAHAPGPRGARI